VAASDGAFHVTHAHHQRRKQLTPKRATRWLRGRTRPPSTTGSPPPRAATATWRGGAPAAWEAPWRRRGWRPIPHWSCSRPNLVQPSRRKHQHQAVSAAGPAVINAARAKSSGNFACTAHAGGRPDLCRSTRGRRTCGTRKAQAPPNPENRYRGETHLALAPWSRQEHRRTPGPAQQDPLPVAHYPHLTPSGQSNRGTGILLLRQHSHPLDLLSST
jgi:hypothetical protein